MWLGPKPSVFIWEPQLIKEILLNYTVFQKPGFNALTKLLSEGLVSYEGDKWSKHRKIITPAFHVEKLKVLFLFQIKIMFSILYICFIFLIIFVFGCSVYPPVLF